MSLTSILDTKHARRALKPLIRNPRMPEPPPVLVPSASSLPSRMGTTFDYALRFGLAARAIGILRPLIAKSGVVTARAMAQRSSGSSLPKAAAQAEETYWRALTVVQSEPFGAELSVDAARACFDLAGLDLIFRIGRFDQLNLPASDAEVAELRELYRIVPWHQFLGDDRTLLNPTFGEGSRMVGGADADLIRDDLLIDVKTLKEQRLTLCIVRQLVGYALLANRFGIDRSLSIRKIRRLGVYYSRAGYLHEFPLRAAVDPADDEPVLRFLATGGLEPLKSAS